MENNNGRGIFYGVIGVATLIVAIIGATFAYFSAQQSSEEDVIKTSGAKVGLTWLENKDGLKNNLIPVDTTKLFASGVINGTETGCKDTNEYNVCSVYQFGVENPGSVSQDITVSLDSVTNSFKNYKTTGTTNLRYAIFDGWESPESLAGALVGETAVGEGQNALSGVIAALNKTLSAADATDAKTDTSAKTGDTARYTIVLWIKDTGEAQDDDQEKAFAAGVTISGATGGGQGISGTFGA